TAHWFACSGHLETLSLPRARPCLTLLHRGTRKQAVRHCALSPLHGRVSIASSRGCQGSTKAHASAVPLLSAGLDLGEKLQDPVDVCRGRQPIVSEWAT